jgi:hypothetical protein
MVNFVKEELEKGESEPFIIEDYQLQNDKRIEKE